MQNRFKLKLFILLFSFFPVLSTYAQQVQKTFKVSASVINGCRIKNLQGSLNVVFPDATPGVKVDKTNTTFELSCTPGVSPGVTINSGLNPGSDGTRQMVSEENPVSKVSYDVYDISNSGKKEWPAGESMTFPSVSVVNIEFDADLTSFRGLTPGKYSDQLVMSISW